MRKKLMSTWKEYAGKQINNVADLYGFVYNKKDIVAIIVGHCTCLNEWRDNEGPD